MWKDLLLRNRIGMNRFRRVFFRLFVCFLAVLVGLFCLELYLRTNISGTHTQMLPQPMIDQHVEGGFRYDRDLMWYWTSLPHERMGVNAVGFRRSKSMMVQKPVNVTRVIALGDSQVYGGGVGKS